MRWQPLCLLALLGSGSAARAQSYSVRDVAFLDVETRPYQLVILDEDPSNPALKLKLAALQADFVFTNITPVLEAPGSKSLPAPLKEIKLPRPLKMELCFLVTPDDRVVPFQFESRSMFARSRLRDEIIEEVTHALCAVLLLESKDAEANKTVRTRVEKVLDQINSVRTKFDRAPAADVKLLTLSTKDRERECWNLWGLGDDPAAADTPKVAVIYGKMRRAGALLEGTGWKEAELFERIAVLAQPWGGDVRKLISGPALPYNVFPMDAVDGLNIDRTNQKVLAEINAMLSKPPIEAPEPRKLAYDDWLLHKPNKMVNKPEIPEPVQPNEAPEPNRPNPPVLASHSVAVMFLILGVTGWIALSIAVWMLERRRPPSPS